MRNEIKIPVDKNFVLSFENWKDFKNKISKPYENRFVNSIYFDDDNFVTAQNNLSGISERKKYRIRWYNNELNNFTYEIKIKKNNFGKKINLDSKVTNHKILDLFSFKNKFFHKNENKFFLNYVDNINLKPKLKINYLRSYLLFNGKVRITFDQKINYKLINNFGSMKEKIDDHMNVIEIKYKPEDAHMAFDLIKDSKFIPKRFSKYLRGLHLSGIANYI